MKKSVIFSACAVALISMGFISNPQISTANVKKEIKVYQFKHHKNSYKLLGSKNRYYTGTLKKGKKISYNHHNYYYVRSLKGYISKENITVNNNSSISNKNKTDTNHKYIIGANGHQAALMSTDQFKQLVNQSDNGSFGSISGFDGNLVHIIKSQDVAGYTFYEIDQITGKNDKDKFWIYSGNLSNNSNENGKYVSLDTVYNAQTNNAIINKSKQEETNDSKYFTSDELNQINEYQSKAKSIGDVTNPYTIQPSYSNAFNIGQLNPDFIKNTVDWINFYRNMMGLYSINDDSAWDTEAQYGAVTLAAANQGLSHGLVGFTQPNFISQDDWSRGATATASSNLAEGVTIPYDIVSGYINDSGHNDPGHRQWLLGNIDKVGIGQAGQYNDIKVFDNSEKETSAIWNFSNNAMAYPKEGLFPINLADSGAAWSYSLPEKISDFPSYASHYHVTHKDPTNETDQYDPQLDSSTVKVHDNTTNQDVPVSNVTLNGGAGNMNSNITYLPDSNYIKTGHSYTITIGDLPNNKTYTYTTKLFNLKGSAE